VNLIESPDHGVIVIVRFREEHTGRTTSAPTPLLTAPNVSSGPAS
jgi:hypothetical protein